MVCRMDLQTVDGKSVMDEAAYFQLLFWSLEAIVSLFRIVQVGATTTAPDHSRRVEERGRIVRVFPRGSSRLQRVVPASKLF